MVFHEHDALPVPPQGAGGGLFFAFFPGHFGGRRKVYLERGTLAGLALHLNPPLVLLDYAQHHGQSESGSFAHRLGGEERFKDVFLDKFVHACSRVRQQQADKPAGPARTVLPAILLVHGHVPGPNCQFPAVRHGVPCIDGKVHDHLFDGSFVALQGPELLLGVKLDGDILSDNALQHFHQRLHRVVEIDRLE